jgi:hypothetical protein
MTAKAAETIGLMCLPKHTAAPDNKFLVTHPMTDCNALLPRSYAEVTDLLKTKHTFMPLTLYP